MHTFAIKRGNPKTLDKDELWFLKRFYSTQYPNHYGHAFQVNNRRLRFIRVTVPIECEEQFLKDLSPYGGSGGLRKPLQKMFGILFKALNLTKVPASQPTSPLGMEGWRSCLNIMVFGKKEREISEKDMQKFLSE